MILGTLDTIPGERSRHSHGGAGECVVRTLLDGVPGSAFKYVRDLTLYPGSNIKEHRFQPDTPIHLREVIST
jgi:hypothetical protein